MAEAPLVSVVYVSSAVRPFAADDLVELLRRSRERNAREGVTGMLLHRSGNFIQAVEGPSQAIDALLERIDRDKRHTGIITILRRPIAQREFGEWSMGFDDLTDARLSRIAGYNDFLRRVDSGPMGTDESTIALRMLDRFKQTNR